MLQVKWGEVYEAAFGKESEMFYEHLQLESLNFCSFQILLIGGCLAGQEGCVKIFVTLRRSVKVKKYLALKINVANFFKLCVKRETQLGFSNLYFIFYKITNKCMTGFCVY